jgi:putative ABC transport system permease protein
MFDNLRQDLRYGLVTLRRSPALAAIAVASLGLGIGATVSMFIAVNAALFRPLPVDSPDELVFLYTGSRESPYSTLSYPDYLDYRDGSGVFAGLAAYGEITVSFSAEATPDLARGVIASGNFFQVLGVGVALGRTFTSQDDRNPGEHPVVVISHGLWQRRFGADPQAVGRAVSLNGRPYTVIGILPLGFRGPDVLESYDLYVPLMMQPYVRPPPAPASLEKWIPTF